MAGSQPPAGASGTSTSPSPRGTAGLTFGTPINGPAPSTVPPGNWSAAPGNSPPPPLNGATPPPALASALGSASSLPPALTNALSGLASASSSTSSASTTGTSSTPSPNAGGSWGSATSQPPPGMGSAGQGLSLPSPSSSPNPDNEPDSLKPLAAAADRHAPPAQPNRCPVRNRGGLPTGRRAAAPGRIPDHQSGTPGPSGRGQPQRGPAARELTAIVRRRAQVDPLIRPKPRIKFLVETGGGTTFWTAQQQLIFSNLDWPMTMQVAGPQTALMLDDQQEARR